MSKQMIINANAAEEIRVAIVENDKLVDLDIENQSRTKHKGNIYKGIVANVEDSLEAAFIEFGDDKQAFLALSEVRPSLFPEGLRGTRRPKISDVLKRGQEIVVQVTKDEIGNKGAAVTTYLSLPGRYTVLMHSDDSGGGISRKIDDEQARRRAREILSHIQVPDGMAVIIRTAGMNRPMVDLYRDLKALAKVWESIDRGAQLGRAPTLLYREPDLIVRTIRDYLSPDISKIVIDAEEEYDEIKGYFEERMADSLRLLDLHQGRQPIFEAYGIEKAIEELYQREVKLPSGGYLVIDQTEALVAIDVNSGRSTREDDHEATVYKTNLEAAEELARQLRLRDLGGIIVVDLIDMANKRHDRDVERAVREAMKGDKARVKIGRISDNGTLEITRQRLRQAHRLISHTPCPSCGGTGVVRDASGLSLSALRQLQARLAKVSGQLSKLTLRLPVAVANVLANSKRRDLFELSEQHQIEVEIHADSRLQGNEIKFDEERRGKAGLDAAGASRDPRLDADRGRGRGRRRGRRDREEGAPSQQIPNTVPPPSIGTVPLFLADEETIAAAEERALQEREAEGVEAAEARGRDEGDEPMPPRDRAERGERDRSAHEAKEHFDDPLTEALFGAAPDVPLADVEAPAEAAAAAAAEGPPVEGEVRRRRRRRRSRRGRGRNKDGTPMTDAQQAAANAAEGIDDEGNEEEGADEGDQPSAEAAEGAIEGSAQRVASGPPPRSAPRPPVTRPPLDAEAPSDDADAEEGEASAEGVEAAEGAEGAEGEAPRRRRSRRGRRGRGRGREGEAGAAGEPVAAAGDDAAPAPAAGQSALPSALPSEDAASPPVLEPAE